jgi:hypothetical protein
MSTFRIPTFTELRQLFIDLIRSLIPEAALQVGEDYEREANILAGVGQSLMGPLTTIEDQIFPDTANDANVALHGELENLPRKQPSTASGLALLLGTTTAGAVQPSGSTATSQTGVSVFLTGPATTILPGWPQARILSIPALDTLVVSSTAGMSTGDTFDLGGSIYVVRDLPGGGAVVIYGTLETVPILRDLYPIYITPALAAIAAIEASSEGAAGNLSFGSVLTLDNPASGISPTGRVMVLADGSDLETFREWGRRIRNHRRVKPRDANAAAQRDRSIQLGVGAGEFAHIAQVVDLTDRGDFRHADIGAHAQATNFKVVLLALVAERAATAAAAEDEAKLRFINGDLAGWLFGIGGQRQGTDQQRGTQDKGTGGFKLVQHGKYSRLMTGRA